MAPNANADEMAKELDQLHQALTERLTEAQNAQAQYYDKSRQRMNLDIGDLVWLSTTNVRSRRPSKKLNHKRLGPFKVDKVVSPNSYRLILPYQMRIHPIFHVSLLEPYHGNTLEGRVEAPPPPISKITDKGDDRQYEIDGVLNSKYIRRKLQYFVSWKGYGPEDNQWEPAAHLKEAPELVHAFHQRHPFKPGPEVPQGKKQAQSHQQAQSRQ